MSKFHIKKDGTPGQCRATKGSCPLGGADSHYDSAEAAQAAAQERLEKQFGVTGSHSSKDDVDLSKNVSLEDLQNYVGPNLDEAGDDDQSYRAYTAAFIQENMDKVNKLEPGHQYNVYFEADVDTSKLIKATSFQAQDASGAVMTVIASDELDAINKNDRGDVNLSFSKNQDLSKTLSLNAVKSYQMPTDIDPDDPDSYRAYTAEFVHDNMDKVNGLRDGGEYKVYFDADVDTDKLNKDDYFQAQDNSGAVMTVIAADKTGAINGDEKPNLSFTKNVDLSKPVNLEQVKNYKVNDGYYNSPDDSYIFEQTTMECLHENMNVINKLKAGEEYKVYCEVEYNDDEMEKLSSKDYSHLGDYNGGGAGPADIFVINSKHADLIDDKYRDTPNITFTK